MKNNKESKGLAFLELRKLPIFKEMYRIYVNLVN